MKKYLFLLTTLIVLFSCKEPRKNTTLQVPRVDKTPWRLNCDNEKLLITDLRNNLEVNIDSITDFSDYIKLCNKKTTEFVRTVGFPDVNILDSLLKYGDNIDTLNVIFKDFDPHPQVFPYVIINNEQISLMQILRSSGVGCFSKGNGVLMVNTSFFFRS